MKKIKLSEGIESEQKVETRRSYLLKKKTLLDDYMVILFIC